jgi:DNA-binding NarL/FixJ family response regulator
LIVDDQMPFLEASRMVVDMTDGFEVAGDADSGEEAVRLARELAPDLVLMDIKMSGIGGLEATRRIVARHRDVRVVALSTYDEYAELAVDAGVAAFISKAAFDSERLIAAWSAAS